MRYARGNTFGRVEQDQLQGIRSLFQGAIERYTRNQMAQLQVQRQMYEQQGIQGELKNFGEFLSPAQPDASAKVPSPTMDETSTEMKGGSVSFRHNNPGNMKFNPETDAVRVYGASQGEAAPNGGFYAKFPSVPHAVEATKDMLTSGEYGKLPLDKAMRMWSAGNVESTSGYGAKEISPEFADRRMDSLTPDELAKVTDAMQKQEGWVAGTPARAKAEPMNQATPSEPRSPQEVYRKAIEAQSRLYRYGPSGVKAAEQVGQTARAYAQRQGTRGPMIKTRESLDKSDRPIVETVGGTQQKRMELFDVITGKVVGYSHVPLVTGRGTSGKDPEANYIEKYAAQASKAYSKFAALGTSAAEMESFRTEVLGDPKLKEVLKNYMEKSAELGEFYLADALGKNAELQKKFQLLKSYTDANAAKNEADLNLSRHGYYFDSTTGQAIRGKRPPATVETAPPATVETAPADTVGTSTTKSGRRYKIREIKK